MVFLFDILSLSDLPQGVLLHTQESVGHFRIVIHCHTQAPRNSLSIASSKYPSVV